MMTKTESLPVNRSRSRLYGLLMLCVIFLPMAVAYVMFTTGWGIPAGTTNKGILLQPPRSVGELNLQDSAQSIATLYGEDQKKWRLLVPVAAACDDHCQQQLYLTRQVHIRLAEKAYRVERLLLLLDSLPPDKLQVLKDEHPGTLIFTADGDKLESWLEQNQLPAAADRFYYLVDQEGFAMMRYGAEHKGQDLLDDLKKLLKFTYDK